MEFIGEEKRIQGLFRELKLDDERLMPRFASMWNCAQLSSSAQRHSFKFSVVAVLVVCALFSLAWWSRYWQRSKQPNVLPDSSSIPVTIPIQTVKKSANTVISDGRQRHPFSSRAHVARRPAPRQVTLLAANRLTTREALVISSWQSPTATLLRSPADEVLISLPRLSESVKELKSFLANTSN